MTIPRWKFQILLLASLLLSGCGQNSKDKTGDLPVIDIVGNLGNYETVPVSQYITELEYIPLETNDDCLVAEENLEVLATSTHIFVRGLKYCYAFDRNGRFLGQIGRLGQGPGEFSFLTGLFIDKKNQSLYLETFRTLLEYSWDGGLSFWPKYYTSDNEFIDLWRAEDMKEFLTEEYFATHDIKDPAAHQKLKELLQKLKEDDNPVIVIGKLKPEVISPNN